MSQTYRIGSLSFTGSNAGFNTTTPAATLEINGTTRLGGNTSLSISDYQLLDNSGISRLRANTTSTRIFGVSGDPTIGLWNRPTSTQPGITFDNTVPNTTTNTTAIRFNTTYTGNLGSSTQNLFELTATGSVSSLSNVLRYLYINPSTVGIASEIAVETVRGDIMLGTSGTGSVYIGTTTTSSFKLDVSGSGNFTNGLTVTGSLNVVTGSNITLAISGGVAPTLRMTTSSFELSGIIGTVLDYGNSNILNLYQTVWVRNKLSIGGFNTTVIQDNRLNVKGYGTGSSTINTVLVNSSNTELFKVLDDGTTTVNGSLTVANGDFSVVTGSTNYLKVFPSTGNTFIGSTPVDDGFKLDVNGTIRSQNTNYTVPSIRYGGLMQAGIETYIGSSTTSSRAIWGNASGNALTLAGNSRFGGTAGAMVVIGALYDFSTPSEYPNNSPLLRIGYDSGDWFGDTTQALSNIAFETIQIRQKYNVTGSTNRVIGIDYDPVFVNSPQTHYAAIFRSGFVGIGTATPSSLLDVSGSGRFTNGLTVTGSFTVNTGSTEFQVLDTGTKIGNAATDIHTITGSVAISGSTLTFNNNEFTLNSTTTRIGNTSTDIVNITGSVTVSNTLTASAALISGSGTSRLRVFGSGSDSPIMTVGGSSGQLFTITDSLSGALFTVNNISALPILTVNSDDTVRIGASNAMGLYTSYRVTTTTTNTEIYKVSTGSYDGLFVDYTIRSGSNARVGQFMSIWSGSQVNYTEVSASQFGDTSGFTFAAYVSQSFMNISSSATTNGWDVKTIIRSI
jgi:hypothetical protein